MRSARHVIFLTLALSCGFAVVQAACVGDDPGPTPAQPQGDASSEGAPQDGKPTIRSFAASPSALPAGGGSVTLSYDVADATSLTIDHDVGEVTGTSSKRVDVKVTTLFTLTAKNAKGSVTATAKVALPETITVSGTIVAWGLPVAGIAVIVAGKPAVTTSATGTFSVADVKPPYDVAFASNATNATIYQGLTRKDPKLVAYETDGPPTPPLRSTQSVVGSLTSAGGQGPPFSEQPIVTLGGPRGVAGLAAVMSNGAFTLNGPEVQWHGPPAVLATVHGSYVKGPAGAEQGFYGKTPGLALNEGSNVGGVAVTITFVDVTNATATVTGPAAYGDAAKTITRFGVRFDDGGGYDNGPIPTTFPKTLNGVFPRAPGGTASVSVFFNRFVQDAETSAAQKAGSLLAVTTLAVSLVEPPRPKKPDDAASNVTAATSFDFDAFPKGIQRVTFFAAGQPSLTVFTKATSIKIPDVAGLGVAIPKGVMYRWRTVGYAPLTSLDDDALAATIDIPDGNLPPLVDVSIAASAPRVFTLAP